MQLLEFRQKNHSNCVNPVGSVLKYNLKQDSACNYILSRLFPGVSLNEVEFENRIQFDTETFREKPKWKKLTGAKF